MHAELQLVEDAATPAAAFKDAMSALAAGVVLVVTDLDGRPWGTTVTSFTSVSADPPTVLASLRTGSTAERALARSRQFGVLLLHASQLELARACAVPGAQKHLGPDAAAQALAVLDCSVIRTVVVEDHTLVVARVRAARLQRPNGPPLIHYRRSYR